MSVKLCRHCVERERRYAGLKDRDKERGKRLLPLLLLLTSWCYGASLHRIKPFRFCFFCDNRSILCIYVCRYISIYPKVQDSYRSVTSPGLDPPDGGGEGLSSLLLTFISHVFSRLCKTRKERMAYIDFVRPSSSPRSAHTYI